MSPSRSKLIIESGALAASGKVMDRDIAYLIEPLR